MHTDNITGTSTNTSKTVAKVAPDFKPNNEIVIATANAFYIKILLTSVTYEIDSREAGYAASLLLYFY